MSLAAGLLLAAIGGVWWKGARGVDEVRRKFVATAEHEQHQSLREHLRALEEFSMMLGTIQAAVENVDKHTDPNHDLPLKVCNEINRIEKNLLAMDSSIRGHKKLVGCVRRVKNNLRAHDYHLTELVGRPYDGGMLLEADFVVEDNKLAPGGGGDHSDQSTRSTLSRRDNPDRINKGIGRTLASQHHVITSNQLWHRPRHDQFRHCSVGCVANPRSSRATFSRIPLRVRSPLDGEAGSASGLQCTTNYERTVCVHWSTMLKNPTSSGNSSEQWAQTTFTCPTSPGSSVPVLKSSQRRF